MINSNRTPQDRIIRRIPHAEFSGCSGNRWLGNNPPQSNPARWSWHLVIAVFAITRAVPAGAQQPEPISSTAGHSVHWWQRALAVGGLTGLVLLDKPAQRFAQDSRSPGGNDLARAVRHIGQPEVYGAITLGLVTTGLVTGQDDVTRAGGRLAATLVLAGATATVTKMALGRPRPSESMNAEGFVPFSGQDAMPSGHTTMAFALATALADDIRNPLASFALYSLAAGVGWSRLNDNRHWLSDVSAGAVLGITSAKIINGRWRIFNLQSPQVLIGPGNAEFAWQISF